MEIRKELLKITEVASKVFEIAISVDTVIRNQLNIESDESSMVSLVGRSKPVCLVNITLKECFVKSKQARKETHSEKNVRRLQELWMETVCRSP